MALVSCGDPMSSVLGPFVSHQGRVDRAQLAWAGPSHAGEDKADQQPEQQGPTGTSLPPSHTTWRQSRWDRMGWEIPR